MELTLSINTERCIRCGRCVRICPAKIFTQEREDEGAVGLQHIESCIVCGHCMAACPTNAVVHSEFPDDRVHPIDPALIPGPEQMMLLCKARRSNRAFTSKPIPAENLEMILEAAHRAPTASNRQQVGFTLVTDPRKLRAIATFTIDVFSSVVKKLNNPLLKPVLRRIMPDAYRYVEVFERMQEDYVAGNDPILRKATAVILIHTPRSDRFGCADANLAYQNGSLMAECLGVSQFYTGFVLAAIEQKKDALEKLLGIDGTVRAGMALGMPSFRCANYIDRKPIVLNRL